MDRSQINGVAVIERTKAKMSTPLSNGVQDISTVDEVLLEDGSIVFQCVFPGLDCGWIGNGVRSVISHQVAHSPKRALRKVLAETEQIRQKEEDRKQRNRESALRSIARKKEAAAAAKATETKVTEVTPDDNEFTIAVRKIEDNLNYLEAGIAEVRKNVREVMDLLPVADPALIAKAKKWDELQLLMGGDK